MLEWIFLVFLTLFNFLFKGFLSAGGLYLTVGRQERKQREWGKTCTKGPQAGTQIWAGCAEELQRGMLAQPVELNSTPSDIIQHLL